ncbi:hypothetical protein [Nakamurella endophytica]|uniref:Uncharacterized protein n=1 Tax=Nakamurella endophytica TaxID=1748367 RepID=A0A917T345_9ACTN|nr:hypothetical protein [Nakamurella endophytica]GGM08657.1 hypothetical protein GCM10011594_30710 [Nakamurella endophytica]
MTTPDLVVLCCRPDRAAAEADPVTRDGLAALGGRPVQFVGARPGKEIDPALGVVRDARRRGPAAATPGTGAQPADGQPADGQPADGQPADGRPGEHRDATRDPAAGTGEGVPPAVADQPAGTPVLGRRPADRRVVVLGDDADLAAVVLRLLRADLLGSHQVGYVAGRRSPVTALHSLPIGAAAARLALDGEPDLVTLVRDDNGGVLVGRAELSPVDGPVYVDEHLLLRGRAPGLVVDPDQERGVEVTVLHRQVLGIGRRPRTRTGRAVQIASRVPMTVVSDGVPRSRPTDRWTLYRHTAPLRLVRGLLE